MLRKTIALNKRSVYIQAVFAARNWANVQYLFISWTLICMLLVWVLFLGCFYHCRRNLVNRNRRSFFYCIFILTFASWKKSSKNQDTLCMLFQPSSIWLESISLCVLSLIYMRGWLENETWKWIFKKPSLRVINRLDSLLEIVVIWNIGDLSTFGAFRSLLAYVS